MRFGELKGSEEVEKEVAEIRRQYLESIEPEERLRGLGAEDKAKMLALLLAERDK